MTATFISICFVLTNCVCALIIIIGMINLLLLLLIVGETEIFGQKALNPQFQEIFRKHKIPQKQESVPSEVKILPSPFPNPTPSPSPPTLFEAAPSIDDRFWMEKITKVQKQLNTKMRHNEKRRGILRQHRRREEFVSLTPELLASRMVERVEKMQNSPQILPPKFTSMAKNLNSLELSVLYGQFEDEHKDERKLSSTLVELQNSLLTVRTDIASKSRETDTLQERLKLLQVTLKKQQNEHEKRTQRLRVLKTQRKRQDDLRRLQLVCYGNSNSSALSLRKSKSPMVDKQSQSSSTSLGKASAMVSRKQYLDATIKTRKSIRIGLANAEYKLVRCRTALIVVIAVFVFMAIVLSLNVEDM